MLAPGCPRSTVHSMIDPKACVIDAGFSASARVRSKRDYAEVFGKGRKASHPLLALHWLVATDASGEQPRLGLAVSRKVTSRAVGRNRIKRVLRDVFRHHRADLAAGMYVVVARSAAASADNQQLRDALLGLLQRAGALPPPPLTGTMPAPITSSARAGTGTPSS